MGVGRYVNRALGRVGLHLSQVPRHRVTRSALSPELARETEIVNDLTQFPANDLRRWFLDSTAQDLHKWHHYFDIYDQCFSGFRGRADLRVLEIGVSRGGSLKMWRGYFGPGAVIVGLDVDPGCKKHENADGKIFVEIGDQADTAFLARVVESFGPFDIIIDDGGHTAAQQTISFNHLYAEALRDGGVYLVEDLHSNYWPAFLDADRSFIEFAKSLIDRLHEPYFENQAENLFREGKFEQKRSMMVSSFCANTRSIAFYDSIVVFEKRRKTMPATEIR